MTTNPKRAQPAIALSVRIRNKLTRGLGDGWTLEALANFTLIEFLRIQDIGYKSLGCIAEVLKANGFNGCFVEEYGEHEARKNYAASKVRSDDGRKWTAERREARTKLRALHLSPEMVPIYTPFHKPLKTLNGVVLGYANIDGTIMCRVRRNGVVDAVAVGDLTRPELDRYIELADIKKDREAKKRLRLAWLAAPHGRGPTDESGAAQ